MPYSHVVAPLDVAKKLRSFVDGFDIRDVPSIETYGELTVEPIYGVHFDGYTPFTEGGFMATVFVRNCVDSTYCLTTAQIEFNDRLYDEVYDQFLDDYGLDCNGILDEEDQTELEEYLLDAFEPALFDVAAYVKDNKVQLELAINYKDAPYFRRGAAEIVAELTLSFDEFLAADVEQLALKLIDNI